MVADANLKLPRGLELALRFAATSDHPLHKLGAVLIKNGNLIGYGVNKNRTHPRSPHIFCIHAEVDALIKYRFEVESIHMFVIRMTRGGSVGTSKPCAKCMVLIREAGIESVTYIDENGRVKKEEL